MRLLNKKTLLVLFVFLAVASLALLNIGGQNTLEVSTDTTPVTLELNELTYTISGETQKISLPEATYTYRATATMDGKRIALGGKINLEDNDSFDLPLRYKLYTNSAVSEALCATTGQIKDCPFQPDSLVINYLESYAWAVATINSPGIGTGLAVLYVENGKWAIADGPGTDIETVGYYPQSVERAIYDARK